MIQIQENTVTEPSFVMMQNRVQLMISMEETMRDVSISFMENMYMDLMNTEMYAIKSIDVASMTNVMSTNEQFENVKASSLTSF
jgi:hypothetical protein